MSEPSNFDRRDERWGWFWRVVLGLAAVGLLFLCRFLLGEQIGFVVWIPLLGAMVATVLIRGVPVFLHGMHGHALKEINGDFYSFDGHEIRILWRENQCWVSASHAFAAMREPVDSLTFRKLLARLGPGSLWQDENGGWWLSEKASVDWMANRMRKMDEKALRFRNWLDRDVFPPRHKREEVHGMEAKPHPGAYVAPGYRGKIVPAPPPEAEQ